MRRSRPVGFPAGLAAIAGAVLAAAIGVALVAATGTDFVALPVNRDSTNAATARTKITATSGTTGNGLRACSIATSGLPHSANRVGRPERHRLLLFGVGFGASTAIDAAPESHSHPNDSGQDGSRPRGRRRRMPAGAHRADWFVPW
jgi:hypothetical protein